jgi:transcriptional regulator with XRE-family HTH domain
MVTPQEMLNKIAKKAKAKRLFLNLSQKTLSNKSGVSYGVLKKFENTGQISSESLLKLSLALGSLGDFNYLFEPNKSEDSFTLDELIQETKRKRGRK